MLYILHIHICVHLYTERSSRTYTSSLILINFKYLLSKQNVPNFNEIPAIISSLQFFLVTYMYHFIIFRLIILT